MTRPDAPSDDPLLIVDDRVAAATDEVLAAGVGLGMSRREAEALAPFATVMLRDLGEETRRFEEVVALVEDLVPRVEVVSPGLIFVPVAGALRYYGGEEALAKRVSEAISGGAGGGSPPSPAGAGTPPVGGRDSGGGWTFKVGIADGPFAARWAAATASPGEPLIIGDTIGFLSRLDLVTLREAMGGEEMIDTFRWLGIETLGDLAGLPRETLASRFGNPGLAAHRLASGDDRMVDPREIPVDLTVEMSFEEPLESLDSIAFAGRNLAEKLLGRLRSRGVAPHAVSITAEAAHGRARSRVWRSADPFTDKALSDRVWWQLRAWVEASGVPGGISALRIVPTELSGAGRQLGLFTDESSIVETERAFARAQAILGPDGVLQARAQGGRMPGERVVWSRWGEPETTGERDPSAPWPGATPSPAPALVPPRLDPIEIEWDTGMPARVRLGSRWEPILTWSGPWRMSGRWWDGGGDADRYQLVTSAGAFLCVVADGRAFLAGIYD
ncbi:MAG TPA: DNA polymerase Y family protein [Acidimicrobiia bacterium]|nr:DNA polymerase Y family protein [Acidimicrobiia bacterium]